jgi:hypothetical protein
MEQLTADAGSLPGSPAMKPTVSPAASKELDRVLAHAIRRLIAGQNALIADPGERDLWQVV